MPEMKEIINDDLILYYDDDFRLMGEEETGQMNVDGDSTSICIRNNEKHMIVAVGSKKINGFSNLVLNNKDLAKLTQENISRAMRPYSYEKTADLLEYADGQEMRGFAYDYVAEKVPMYGEAYVTKKDRKIYYLYLYVRQECKGNGIAIWKKMIGDLKWKK